MDRNSLKNRLDYEQFPVIFPDTSLNRFFPFKFEGATYHSVRIYCRFDMRWDLCESGTSKSCNWRVPCYTNRLIGCNCFHLDTRKADRSKCCQRCHLAGMIRWRTASNRPNDWGLAAIHRRSSWADTDVRRCGGKPTPRKICGPTGTRLLDVAAPARAGRQQRLPVPWATFLASVTIPDSYFRLTWNRF